MSSVPDIPAFRQSEIISTDRDFGPSVPTIFVIAGKKVCRVNPPKDIRNDRAFKLLYIKSSPYNKTKSNKVLP